MPKRKKKLTKKEIETKRHNIATHNWDVALNQYSTSAGDEVDTAFRDAGYYDPATRRDTIIRTIIDTRWADRKIGHGKGKEGKSGVRGGKGKGAKGKNVPSGVGGKGKKKPVRGKNTDPGGTHFDIQNCKKNLITWAGNHPA